MGTRMDDDDGIGLRSFERREVRVYVQGLSRVVVVLERMAFETKRGKHLVVVRPGWLGDVDVWQRLATVFEQQGCQMKGPRA